MDKYDALKEYGDNYLIVDTRKSSDGFGKYFQEYNYFINNDKQIAFVTIYKESLEDIYSKGMTLEELYEDSVHNKYSYDVSIDIWWDDIDGDTDG